MEVFQNMYIILKVTYQSLSEVNRRYWISRTIGVKPENVSHKLFIGAGRVDRVKILSNSRVFNKIELNIVQVLYGTSWSLNAT